MRRKLNLPLVAILLAAIAVCGVGVHFLHGFQLRRGAGALLREADRAQEAGKPFDSIRYLSNYVRLVPGDTAALARLGIEQSRFGFFSQAFFNLDQALRRDPSLGDARRELVRLATRLGRYRDG